MEIKNRQFSFLQSSSVLLCQQRLATPYGFIKLEARFVPVLEFIYLNSSWDSDAYKQYYQTQLKYHMGFNYDRDRWVYLVEQIKKRGLQRVYDVGCGAGDLVMMARRAGIDAYGINPVVVTKNQFFTIGDCMSLELYQDSDAVLFNGVLEHIYDLDSFLTILSQYKNYIYFEIPNADHFDLRCPLQEINLEHINIFNIVSLTKVLNYYGFDIISLETNNFGHGNVLCCWCKRGTIQSFREYFTIGQVDMCKIKLNCQCLPNNLVVYGVGQLMYKLLIDKWFRDKIDFMVDDNISNCDSEIAGIKILSPTKYLFEKRNVLLGSILHVEQLKNTLQSFNCKKVYELI